MVLRMTHPPPGPTQGAFAVGGMEMAASLVSHHEQRLVRTLEQVGWQIRELAIDTHNNYVVVRLHRADGRWIHVDCTERASSVERWQRQNVDGRTRERRPVPVDVLEDEFLGRIKCAGFRSALREMCNYVASNPAPGFAALHASELRKALGPMT
jgi:hypothetical protein